MFGSYRIALLEALVDGYSSVLVIVPAGQALAAQVEQGFPYLSASSQIQPGRVIQEQVLERLRVQLRLACRQRAADVRVLGSTSLAT